MQKILANPLLWITPYSDAPISIVLDQDEEREAPTPELAPAGLSAPRQ